MSGSVPAQPPRGLWPRVVLVVCLAAGVARAAGVTDFQVKSWSDEEGLPQNWVEFLTQTQDGHLLMGTRAGLVRFDGADFVPAFSIEADQWLMSLGCRNLLEDQDGTLWIATKRGLVRAHSGEFTLFDQRHGLKDAGIQCLALSCRGRLWVGTSRGLALWEGERFIHYPSPTPRSGIVRALAADPHGWVWVSSADGLHRFDPMTKAFARIWTAPSEPSQYLGHGVESLAFDESGRLWFGTRGGAGWVNPGTGAVQLPPDDLASLPGNRQGLLARSARGMWSVGPGGVAMARLGAPQIPQAIEELDGVVVRCALEDREGNLWLGTAHNGLWRLRPRTVRTAAVPAKLKNVPVWSVCVAREGGLWAGTDLGLLRIREGMSERVELHPDLAEISLRSVLETRGGDLWLGSAEKGLFHFRREGPTFRQISRPSPHHQVHALYEDRAGTIWIGLKQGLVRVIPPERAASSPTEAEEANQGFDGEQWQYLPGETRFLAAGRQWSGRAGSWREVNSESGQRYSLEELRGRTDTRWARNALEGGLIDWDVRAVLEDREGTIWIGTFAGGLHRLAHGRIDVCDFNRDLRSQSILALHQDDEGTLWIATLEGLARWQHGALFRFDDAHGLPDGVVNQIVDDEEGHLWLGTHRGVARIRRDELNAVAEGRLSRVKPLMLSRVDGMPANETNGQVQPAGIRTSDGRLWIPTTHGLAVVDPTALVDPPEPAPVLITSVRATDRLLAAHAHQGEPAALGRADIRQPSSLANGQRPIELPPGSGQLMEFQYVSANLTAPEKTRYRHRLDGYDREWMDADRRQAVTYVNLRAGDYRFRVKARDRHGVWSEAPAEFAFVLLPRWHETLWFQIGAVGVLAAAVGGFHLWRVRSRLRLHRLATENQLALERARISRDLHDDLGAWLARAQILVSGLRRSSVASDEAQRLADVEESLRASQQTMREVIWTTDPANDSLESLVSRITTFAQEYLEPLGVRCRLDLPPKWPALRVQVEFRQNLLSAVKEAVHNAVQHGAATEIRLAMRIQRERLLLDVSDNGRGMPEDAEATVGPGAAREPSPDPVLSSDHGNGLGNIRRRVEALGGRLDWSADPAGGATLHVQVPLPS